MSTIAPAYARARATAPRHDLNNDSSLNFWRAYGLEWQTSSPPHH